MVLKVENKIHFCYFYCLFFLLILFPLSLFNSIQYKMHSIYLANSGCSLLSCLNNRWGLLDQKTVIVPSQPPVEVPYNCLKCFICLLRNIASDE